jgi:hypothetical protein
MTAVRRGAVAIVVGSALVASTAACAGPTNLAIEQDDGPYNVDIAMDPQTLNPPQLATLNFTITERDTGRPVEVLTPVYGALVHDVLISRDLLHFQHSYTDRMIGGVFSVLTNFPVTGEYYNHTVFQPQGAEPQHIRSEIATGTAEMSADLVPDTDIPRFSQGAQHELVFGPNPLRAAQTSQLALFISEKGEPVVELDSFLGGPGLMFVTSQNGEHFGIEPGAAPSRTLAPRAGSTPGTPASGATATAVPTRPATGSAPGALQQSQQDGGAAAIPEPTLVPDVADALASVTARPYATLVPVQQTAMASVIETPAVVPATSYGPYVAFSHTFPEPGLYKLWFKTSYRQRVMTVDFVVRVQE